MRSYKGFVLIEALIALIVSAVGLLGVALISSNYLSDSSESKARAEAIAIAQKEIEKLRKLAGEQPIASIANGSVQWPESLPVSGVSDNFYVSSRADSSYSDGLLKTGVVVSWSTGSVTLNTVVVEDIYDSKAKGANGSGSGGSNPFSIDMPTGEAEYGSDVVANNGMLPLGVDLGTVSSSIESGVLKLTAKDPNNTENTIELLTYSGGSAFSEIRGFVYVDYDSTGLSSSDIDAIIVRPADTGLCPKGTGTSVSGSNDWFFEYTCFFGAGWYGNIDVQFIAEGTGNQGYSIDSTKSQCVGDPTYTDDGTDLSHHPQIILAADDKREYRGYGLAFTNGGVIGVDGREIKLVAQGLGEGDVYGFGEIADNQHKRGVGFHDYMIVGNTVTSDSGCSTKLSAVSVSSSGYSSISDAFEDNKGDFICLEVNGEESCPGTVPGDSSISVSAYQFTITGTVSSAYLPASDAVASVTSQFPSGSYTVCLDSADGTPDCNDPSTQTIPVCSVNNSEYSCDFFVASGASWSGELVHSLSEAASNAGYSICSPDGGVDSSFGAVSSSAQGANVVIALSCAEPPEGSIASPNLYWSDEGNGIVGWQSVAGASSYNVYTCTVTSNNITSCDPESSNPSNQMGNRFTLLPSYNSTVCLEVKSVASGEVSAFSQRYCRFKKNNYSTSP
ncbi:MULTISPECIES: hypothetical protein [unclassified Marinobacterium]|jgi:Tfp pilus assembly protein PilV|uniref:type IV pilus modification PilV family protein n=1 Tax=unclassified Marinobacterium TaxID=2644139 RepID=UPI0015693FEF|nr:MULTISPECIES: hypothetical protein [unclassified Marinobacterium]NRP09314.1 hypothetical protein [Marinobacterium sp. xm-g-48]NRP82155.1 hypothetical protein [Marinobacterium sp. xm-d-509]